MTPVPRRDVLAAERAEDVSRFESEGGSPEPVRNSHERAPRGLEPRGSDHRGRILIVVATWEGPTSRIANALALRLRSHGFAVEIGDAGAGRMPPPEDYDVVLLGVPTMFGHESALIAAYVEQHRDGLFDVPSALFTTRRGTIPNNAPDGFLEQFLRSVAWHPNLTAAFADDDRTGVQHFADAVATELARDAVIAERTEPH